MTTHSRLASTFTPSPLRRIFCSVLFLATLVTFVGTIAVSRQPAVAEGTGVSYALQPGKIAPWVMDQTANGKQAEFFVVLNDQADLHQAATLQTKAEKGRFVYNALSNKAQTTQGPILQWLREQGLEYR